VAPLTMPIQEPEGLHQGPAEADASLLEKARRCPRALSAVYQLYAPRITGYVVRRIGHEHDAEDIVANVFVSMVRHLPKYRMTHVPFSAWLYRIATNEINWFLRKRRLRRIFVPMVDVPEARTELSDNAEHVRRCLQKIPVKFQSVLALHYLEQLSVEEVSSVLQIAPGTVKSRLSRGRDLLRKTMARASIR
jgi:RNA polymerase sigma-70 factor (ECF subfamily)